MLTLFDKTYDGESIVDIYRDVAEAIDSRYNNLIDKIPQDRHGFQKGTFDVSIKWVEDDGQTR